MKISLIIDIVLVAIILISAWRGYKAGFITSIIGVVAVVVAIYGANLLATTYAGQFTGLVEPFASGLIDSIETKILGYSPSAVEEEQDFVPVVELTGDDTSSVMKVSTAVLRQLGLDEDIAEPLAQKVSLAVDGVGTGMNVELTKVLSERLCFMALFIIAFILIMIIFTALGNILDLVFGLPGLENINHVLGGALGALRGVVIVLVIACVARYFGIVDIFLGTEIVNETHILKPLMDGNMLSNILGI